MATPLIPLEERLFRMDANMPVLLGSRCDACEISYWPVRRRCAVCHAPAGTVDLSGTGTLHSYTFVHVPWFGKSQMDSAGYGVGQIDLPEGVRIQCVIGGDPESWRIDMPMQISHTIVDERDDADVALFEFVPAAPGDDPGGDPGGDNDA